MNEEWSLSNLPPAGHKECAKFAYSLYEAALAERERLKVKERALENHALYRGRRKNAKGVETKTLVNLFFANVERTVSNVTANNPTAEVIDLDGIIDESEEVMTARLKAWWKETKQRKKHKDSVRNMEIYGYTVEKPFWDHEDKIPSASVVDPFCVLPAPGVWSDWSTDPPYICFVYADYVDAIEAKYNVKGVAVDDVVELLGEQREEAGAKIVQAGQVGGSKSVYGNYADVMHPVSDKGKQLPKQFNRGLVIEVWIRAASEKKQQSFPAIDELTGESIVDNAGFPVYQAVPVEVYPDGIRKITITKADCKADRKGTEDGYMVLDDCANPNINPKLPVELAKTTYPWGRFPVYKADSYRDTTSSYGFSAAEQVGDLLQKIENIFSRLVAYATQALSPTLIVERHCGITREMIEQQAGKTRLVLMPTKPNADIRYLETPNLPATFFNVMELLLGMFDRVYQIEDADRGDAPRGVIAASAIVALQERNAVLMQAKVDSSDSLCSERGMWAIGFWQNFGTKDEPLEVNGKQAIFRGVDYAGRRLNYAVEAGSTVPRTSLQTEEQVKWLAEMRLVDLRTILETINFPNWKAVVERNGENQLDMALSVLTNAGLGEEEAMMLKQYLIQPQNRPEESGGGQGAGGAGVPVAMQGEMPQTVGVV